MTKNQNESLDVSAKTVEEAIEQGLRELGATRNQVEINVLNEGRRGIFGLGAEDAVVRLTVKTPPDEVAAPASVASTPAAPQPPVEAAPGPTLSGEPPDSRPAGESDAPLPVAAPESEATLDPEPQSTEPEPQAETVSEPEPTPEPEPEPKEAEPTAAPTDEPDPLTLAENHLRQMLDKMGVEAEIERCPAPALVDSPDEEPPTVLDITGNDLGVLIGRRSETLQALQYLVRLMVSKEMGSWQRIIIDVESYRSRRRNSLEKMAHRMAERAVATKERVVLEAMTPYERRIVHITLRDHAKVYTKSIGRDHNRKVTIIPK